MAGTQSATTTFTLSHARELAGKVVADLYQCHLFYGRPSMESVHDYQAELETLLAKRFVSRYEFGFKRNGQRVASWLYTVRANGSIASSDGAGGIAAGLDVSNTSFFNYMWRSDAWWELATAQRDAINATLPFTRTGGDPPVDGQGHWIVTRTYSAGGVEVERKEFQPR